MLMKGWITGTSKRQSQTSRVPLRVAPLSSCSQGISIANPTTKEPFWIAFTTMTIMFQSSTQNELSNVNRNNSLTKEVMGAKPAAAIECSHHLVSICCTLGHTYHCGKLKADACTSRKEARL